MDNDSKLEKEFTGCCYVFANVIIGIFGGGFTFMKLWEWTVVEIFNFQAINYFQSLGLATLLAFTIHKSGSDKDNYSLSKMVILPIARLLAAMGMVYLFKQWY